MTLPQKSTNDCVPVHKCRLVFKSGRASSNVVGIICPLNVIGLTELSNSGWGKAHPAHPLAASLLCPLKMTPKNWWQIQLDLGLTSASDQFSFRGLFCRCKVEFLIKNIETPVLKFKLYVLGILF